jgi:hypothetical protein
MYQAISAALAAGPHKGNVPAVHAGCRLVATSYGVSMSLLAALVLQGHLLSVKGHLAASLDAAVASEQEAGASRLATKQVRRTPLFDAANPSQSLLPCTAASAAVLGLHAPAGVSTKLAAVLALVSMLLPRVSR